MMVRWNGVAVVVAVFVVACFPAVSAAYLTEEFDGGGNTAYTLTQVSGSVVPVLVPGATGNAVRVTNLQGGGWGTVAFDQRGDTTGPARGIKLVFDIRMTDDAANDAVGGCCGQAADGVGLGLFSTSTYGATGGSVPGGAYWERPSFPDAFAVGFDIIGEDDVNLNWAGAQVAAQPFPFVVNNNLWHRAEVDIRPSGTDSLVDMTLIEDVHGAAIQHTIFSSQVVSGMDLSNLFDYRLILGGRTGGAYHNGELDNIFLTEIPEPSGLALAALALLTPAFCGRRRSRRR